jgi:AraC family transcriptional regulator, glycine betaine-responsive activator
MSPRHADEDQRVRFGSRSDTQTVRVALFVEQDFPLAPLSMVIEALRLANWVENRTVFRHEIVSADGAPRLSSSEQSASVVHSVATCPTPDVLLVCTGQNSSQISDPGVLRWLRRCFREGSRVGGISSGAFLLARAGLLDGRTIAVHWESRTALAESFANVTVSGDIFVVDGRIITCAGGVSTLDMMVALIETIRGRAVARRVADGLIYHAVRDGSAPARIELRHRTGVSNSVLLRAIQMMESNLEEPVKLAEISASVGTSLRHLERLFARAFDVSPSQYYMRLRLREAKGLLSQSEVPLVEVALRCGFQNTSHFARRYREVYHLPPSEERRAGS